MSQSNVKRSVESKEELDTVPSKLRRLGNDPSSSSSSSSSNGDSSDEDEDPSSKSSSFQSSTSSSSMSSNGNQEESHIKELTDILHDDEDSKSDFVFPSNNESSNKVLSDDIFDDLMHYDASVAEAITNNHLESNRELIDRQMGLFEEEEMEGSDDPLSSFPGGSPSSPPPPPLDPPLPPPPPPEELPPIPDGNKQPSPNTQTDKRQDLSQLDVEPSPLPTTSKNCSFNVVSKDELELSEPMEPLRRPLVSSNMNKEKSMDDNILTAQNEHNILDGNLDNSTPSQNGIASSPHENVLNGCSSRRNDNSIFQRSNSSKRPNSNKCQGQSDPVHETISDDDFDEEELDALVNGDVNVQKSEEQEEPTIAHEERIKIILDDRSKKNFFEVLPDGWIQVSHSSGMPIYLHRPSRVVSLSKPYFLGKGSVKHHAIPVSSIPCLSYKRGLEEEAEAKKRLEAEMNDPDKSKNGCPIFPKARVQSIEEFAVSESLNSEQFREFCKGRFIFKELRIKKFNNWTDRRKFQKQVVKKSLKAAIDKTKETLANNESSSTDLKTQGKSEGKTDGPCTTVKKERPTLPEGTKVLSVPMIELEPLDGNSDNASALNQKIVKKSRKEWIINPVGKSMVCILHEYIQQCLKTQPTYRFEEMESSATPYSATVIINGMEYGRGFGTSKKIAKSEAARITIGILIPEIKNSIPSKSQEGEVDAPDLSFFDDIRIEDPRVNELCSRTSEPSPYTILLNCLQRNYGLGDLNITTELRPLRNKKNEFTMRVDKREVKVVCKNKRDGKQLASQKLLQLLHPHVKSWGSLLSLYGNRAARIQKVKKAKESEVTELQSRSSTDAAPSIAILEKLRKEMLNLRAARNAMAPIGKFVMPLSSTTSSGCKIERINL